jgi:hypothetical protein
MDSTAIKPTTTALTSVRFLSQFEFLAAALKPSRRQGKRRKHQKSVAKMQTQKEDSPGRSVSGYMTQQNKSASQ